jgi:KaiC/GvpD/RAD55 family RecA-like ATPase
VHSEELKTIALLRDEDLQALFLPHLKAHEIVEDVARIAFETVESARCSNLSVLQAHLAQKCHNKGVYDDIMEAFSSVKTPILAESGRASFQAAVQFLERYVRWRKVALIAENMGSQDFQKPFPVIEKYDKLMSACQFKVNAYNNDSLFCFDSVEDFERALKLSTVNGTIVPSISHLITTSLDDEGYAPGTVNMIVAPPGVGKTTFLVGEAVNFLKNGLKVLHYILGDLTPFDVFKKYAANMLKTSTKHVHMYPTEFHQDTRVQQIMGCQKSRVVGAFSLSVDDLYYDAMRLKDQFDYNAILIDYDSNLKSSKSDNLYLDGGYTYGTFERLAREANAILLTASQPKNDNKTWTAEIIGIESASESSRKQHVVDLMATLSQPDRNVPVGRIHLPKVRRGIGGRNTNICYLNGFASILEISSKRREQIEAWFRDDADKGYRLLVDWACENHGFQRSVMKQAA